MYPLAPHCVTTLSMRLLLENRGTMVPNHKGETPLHLLCSRRFLALFYDFDTGRCNDEGS